MADHIVNQIADQFVTLLDRQTDAYDRVFRDWAEQLESRQDLPAIVIQIREDDPQDGSANGPQSSVVRIDVVLLVTGQPGRASRDLLELRKQTYKLLMALAPRFPDVQTVTKIIGGGAEAMELENPGITVGSLRTAYFVTYQHSLTDPSL